MWGGPGGYWPEYSSSYGPWQNYPHVSRGRPGHRASTPYWNIQMGPRAQAAFHNHPLRQLQAFGSGYNSASHYGEPRRGPRPRASGNARQQSEHSESERGASTNQIGEPSRAAINFAEDDDDFGITSFAGTGPLPERIKVKYEVASMEATVSWNRPMPNREDYCYQVAISGHKNAELELPAFKTFCRMQVVPGTWYRVEVKVVEFSGRKVADSETVSFKSMFSRQELIELYQRAATFSSSQCRNPHNPNSSMVEILYFYRCKPTAYWQNDVWPNGGIMSAYMKDENGQPANPINSEVKGLFFAGRLQNGQLPTASIYGNRRFLIHCCRLFHPECRLYFSDFYCNFKTHYVTLVVCLKNTPVDKYCQRTLVELNMHDNIFLKIEKNESYASGFRVYMNNDIWIELLYTDDIDLRYGTFDEVRPMGKGSSTPGGLPNNKYCKICNLYPEEEPVRDTGPKKEPGTKRKASEMENEVESNEQPIKKRKEDGAAKGEDGEKGKMSNEERTMPWPSSQGMEGEGGLTSPTQFDENMPDMEPNLEGSIVEKFYTSTYALVKNWLKSSAEAGPTSLELDISGVVCRLVDSIVEGVMATNERSSEEQTADLYDREVYLTVQNLVGTVTTTLEEGQDSLQVTLHDLEAEAEEEWRRLFGTGLHEGPVEEVEPDEFGPDFEELLFSDEIDCEQMVKTLLERSAASANQSSQTVLEQSPGPESPQSEEAPESPHMPDAEEKEGAAVESGDEPDSMNDQLDQEEATIKGWSRRKVSLKKPGGKRVKLKRIRGQGSDTSRPNKAKPHISSFASEEVNGLEGAKKNESCGDIDRQIFHAASQSEMPEQEEEEENEEEPSAERNYSHLFAQEVWSDEKKEDAIARVRSLFVDKAEKPPFPAIGSPMAFPRSPGLSPIVSGAILRGRFMTSSTPLASSKGKKTPLRRISEKRQSYHLSVSEEPSMWDSYIPEEWKAQEKSISAEDRTKVESLTDSLFRKFSELSERIKNVESRSTKRA